MEFFKIFLVFLRLGLTCFGGPIAHIGYFREEFVVRRKWLEDRAYADIVALCQFLPGPTSSQVGLVIGMHRGGWLGALAAWLGFTLPSAVLMTAFAYGLAIFGDVRQAGWLQGLMLVALAVVAQAVWIMAIKFCREARAAAIGLLSAAIVLVFSSGLSQIAAIALGSLLGWLAFRHESPGSGNDARVEGVTLQYGLRTGAVLLVIFAALLVALPGLANWTGNSALAAFGSFYRAGSFVFGGGHVVLPLLQAGVVRPGWVSDDKFLAGYGLVQAVPGPLFSFAAYLGAVMTPKPHGWVGAVWCLLAIYIPGALIVFGTLPFWENLKRQAFAAAMLKGANAAVVGILLAALYHPLWTSSVHNVLDLILGLGFFLLITLGKCPAWTVVILGAGIGEFLLR